MRASAGVLQQQLCRQHHHQLQLAARRRPHIMLLQRPAVRCRAGAEQQPEQQKEQQQQQDVKRAAAQTVIDQFVSSNTNVAFGNGELVNQAIAYLGDCLLNMKLENVNVVAASSAAAHEAAFFGVPNITLEEAGGKVALLVDQVDQFDESSSARAALKGIRAEPQQPELPRLREAAAAAERVVFLVEGQDVVVRLGGSLPVFVEAGEANEWEKPAEALDDLFLGDAEIWRRPSSGTANPRGGQNPYVSPEGHNILDIRFYEQLKLVGEDAPYEQIVAEIEAIEGVVAHGLLLGVADAVVVADKATGVRVLQKEGQQQQQAAAAPGSSS